MNTSTQKKFTTASFSDYVKNLADLYNFALRDGYYLPSQKSPAINELMLF